MEKRERNVKRNGKSISEIVVILLIITILMSVVKLGTWKKIYETINDLEKSYNLSKEESDKTITEARRKWNEIVLLKQESANIVANQEIDNNQIDYNVALDFSNNMLLIDELKNEVSPEFAEAIEWAEEQNREYSYSKYSPFDKDGFVDSYYVDANKIKTQIEDNEAALQKLEIKQQRLHLAIMLLIAELGVLILKEFVEDKSRLSILSLIMVVFSIVLIIMGI